jgi:hypothetical protein
MASQQLSSDIEKRITEAIRRHPEGIGIAGLLALLDGVISRRSLQRRLASLVEEGTVVSEGITRGAKYRIIATIQGTDSPTIFISSHEDGETYVPISPESAEIKAYIRQPRQQRRPVSYNQSFLEEYRPNETAYLPESLRTQLHSLGRSPATDRPAGTFARDIMSRLLIDLSWSSSRLEGNTYSRLDTERLIQFGQQAEGKDALEAQMILNHKAAIEMLISDADLIGFNPFTIQNLHAILSDGLLADRHSCGRIRARAVEISGSVYLPIALPQRLEELFRYVLATAEAIIDPYEQAFFIMVHLSYLQPFEDVNKRVSRLAANIPLIKQNLCPLSFVDVPDAAYLDGILGVYELNRIELLRDVFVWAYERSCQQYVAVRQSMVQPDTFRLRYRAELSDAVKAIVAGLLQATPEAVNSIVPNMVSDDDHDRFIELVLLELSDLHNGNISRFRIRPSEFDAWRKAFAGDLWESGMSGEWGDCEGCGEEVGELIHKHFAG